MLCLQPGRKKGGGGRIDRRNRAKSPSSPVIGRAELRRGFNADGRGSRSSSFRIAGIADIARDRKIRNLPLVALDPGNEAPSFSIANVNVSDTVGIEQPLNASLDLMRRWAFAGDDPPALAISFQGQ